MNLRSVFVLAAFAAGTLNLSALTTSFSSGSGASVDDTVGGILATFETTGSGGFSQYNDVDASLRNVGIASYTLTFSQAVSNLSFDIIGMDLSWGDTFLNFKVDGVVASIVASSTIHFSSLSSNGSAVWDGSVFSSVTYGNGARMNFAESSITSVTFDSTGNSDSNHWVFFDNFSFEEAVVNQVPDSGSTVLFLVPALMSVLVLSKRRRR